MKIGKTNAIFGSGGGGVLDFVPFVAPKSFNDPKKYADYGCTVNLYEKLKIYKMTYPDADVAVEFTDAYEGNMVYLVAFTSYQIPTGSTIEIFETVAGDERSTLITTQTSYAFTSGSTKRYMIRRITTSTQFILPGGSVWAYCYGITYLGGYPSAANPYLKYIFFYENTLTVLDSFRNTAITGTLTINGGITIIPWLGFYKCENLTKIITRDSVTTISGGNGSGAFQECTSLQVADLGEGITSIGTDTFRSCTSLALIIFRAYNPPTLKVDAFRLIPVTTKFYVPHERVNVYKAADGWNAFASRIYSINDL